MKIVVTQGQKACCACVEIERKSLETPYNFPKGLNYSGIEICFKVINRGVVTQW